MSELILKTDSHPFIDLSNPQCFFNLSPPVVQRAILEIPHDWFDWDEKRLIAQVYNGIQSDTDYEIRLSFWEEYEHCFESLRPMKTQNIVKGIIHQSTFTRRFLTNPGRTLFMITEPSYYKKRQKLTHHLLLNEVLSIAKMPISTDSKTGLPDGKLMDLKLKAYQYLDQRLHGSLVQRVETKSQNLNVNVDATPKAIPNNVEDIDKRIAEMEAELSQTPELPAHEPLLPTDMVAKEAGRVVDAEFVTLRDNRDNSHRE